MSNTSSVTTSNFSQTLDDSAVKDLFVHTFSRASLESQIAKVLGVPSSSGWEIVDCSKNDPKLVLVNYAEERDKTCDSLKGVIVHADYGKLSDSFGYTPTANANTLPLNDEGSIEILDNEGVLHTFTSDNLRIYPYFEGVLIQAAWINGEFLLYTQRKLDISRSRWGTSPCFLELYNSAGGPTVDELFDTSVPYSSTVYSFLVVDKSLLVGSRQVVEAPYVVLLSSHTKQAHPALEKLSLPGVATFATIEGLSSRIEKSGVYLPKNFSVEDANTHLQSGFYESQEVKDPRMATGEAIIVYNMNEDGSVRDVLKVCSTAYNWRSNVMRGDNPNIVHRFYDLLSSVYREINEEKHWVDFVTRYIAFPLHTEEEMRLWYEEHEHFLYLPCSTVDMALELLNRNERIQLLWVNYVFSLPISGQKEALGIFSHFLSDREELITWLIKMERDYVGAGRIETIDIHKNVKSIILRARQLTRDGYKNGINGNNRRNQPKLPVLIRKTIRNLVLKEHGASVYAMIREMKRSKFLADQALAQNTGNNASVISQQEAGITV